VRIRLESYIYDESYFKNNVQTDYDATTHGPNNNVEFKIGDEFLKILWDNSFNGTDGGDVIDHTAKVLEILEWI
ncbi:hypothetical protein Tco_1148093, partial [Tanacetum coccineum]